MDLMSTELGAHSGKTPYDWQLDVTLSLILI